MDTLLLSGTLYAYSTTSSFCRPGTMPPNGSANPSAPTSRADDGGSLLLVYGPWHQGIHSALRCNDYSAVRFVGDPSPSAKVHPRRGLLIPSGLGWTAAHFACAVQSSMGRPGSGGDAELAVARLDGEHSGRLVQFLAAFLAVLLSLFLPPSLKLRNLVPSHF